MEKAIKSLGQNFLKDKGIVNRMVEELGIANGAAVIEIGPGPGIFTKKIAESLNDTNIFTAIELDTRFAKQLSEEFAARNNIKIVEDNFLDWIKTQSFSEDTVVLGSIPYYITSPIIHSLVKVVKRPRTIILMIQKEVAEKICEKNVKPNYFSNFVKTFYNVSYIETVPKDKFSPVPKVDSAILKLVRKDLLEASFNENNFDVSFYEDFLHKGFKHQKKMLNKVFREADLALVNIKGTERPHNLRLEDWLNLFNHLNSVSKR